MRWRKETEGGGSGAGRRKFPSYREQQGVFVRMDSSYF